MLTNSEQTQAKFYPFEKDCYALFVPKFIDNCEALYDDIINEVSFEEKNIKMYGKTVPLPRLISFHAQTETVYKYSGIRNVSKPIPECLNPIIDKINILTAQLPYIEGKINSPNSCLINYYRNGDDYIGWHSDDELQSYTTHPIYSVSLGATRDFEIKKKSTGAVTRITLTNGSLLAMYGKLFQLEYQHRVPKSSTTYDGRINLTFRYHE
jgi:alkylated DNA repair dioxygenase AlkB